MKKKLTVLVIAAALALALPLAAFAADSPTNQSGTVGGVSVSLNNAKVGNTTVTASNFTITKTNGDATLEAALPSGYDHIGCWEVTLTVNGTVYTSLDNGSVTLGFPVGATYNGKTAAIANNHGGTVTSTTATVSGGNASATVSQFSTFGVSVDPNGSSSSGSSTSPKTGTGDMMGLYLLTAAALLGAGVTFALRKSSQH